MISNRKQAILTAAFCLLAAASALMICSMNSWLYPLNPWNDVNIFMTVARGMRRGLLPYRDLMEQKGPLLYALHGLALILTPDSYHGMYLIETMLMAGTLLCFHKIARLYAPRASVGWTAVLAAAICASKTFRFGDCAEELCLLPMAWSMYALLKSWRTGTPLTGRAYVLHGFLAGCILWIKYNLLGLHLVWMGFQAVEALARDRRIGRPLGMCVRFLAGMALATLPWLALFGLNGALDDLWNVYFLANIFDYGPENYNFVLYTGAGILRGLTDLRLSIPLVIALIAVLTISRKRMAIREKAWLMLTAAVMAVAIYGSGVRYVYYFLAFAVFLPFAVIPADGWVRRLIPERWSGRVGVRVAASAALLLVGVGLAWVESPNAKWIGYDYADTAQGQAVAMLAEEDEVTLLNVGDLDAGFYFALDAEPPIPWFTRLNIHPEECREAQEACLKCGAVEYAVTEDVTLEELGMDAPYELVGEVRSPFGGLDSLFRFYRRVESRK